MHKHIKAGVRVELNYKNNKVGMRRKYATKVETVLNNSEVLILAPISGRDIIKLVTNEPLEARFYTESSVFSYDALATAHPIIDDVYLTKLQLISTGEKIQTRDFFRVNSKLNFTFSLVNEVMLGGKADKNAPSYFGLTKDLSGGGMSFVSDLNINEGTDIYANFMLGNEYIVVMGKVRGKQEIEDLTYKYQYRCQFLAVPDSDQEKIVYYTNNQQFNAITQS